MSNQLMLKRECHVCKSTYSLATSLGKWQCREHWGTIRNGVFTCCGMTTYASSFGDFYGNYTPVGRYMGCIRADHNEWDETKGGYQRHSMSNAAIRLNIVQATQLIKCIEESIQPIVGDRNNYLVYRFDDKAVSIARAELLVKNKKTFH